MEDLKILKSDSDQSCICGSDLLSLKYHMSHGHGECGYTGLRILCKECKLSIGDFFGYGYPSLKDSERTWEFWNTYIINIKKKC
jgi:hypothetical protein